MSSRRSRREQPPPEQSSSSRILPPAMSSVLTGLATSKSLSEQSSEIVTEAENALQSADHKEILKWGVMLVGAFTIFKALTSVLLHIAIGVFPGLYIYLRHTCPEATSFDKRKELKRVLRGHHLDEDHPEKPKGYFGSIFARASASVNAETAVMAGTRVQLTPYYGALIVVEMKVPYNSTRLYWVGIAGEWRYVLSRPLDDEATTN